MQSCCKHKKGTIMLSVKYPQVCEYLNNFHCGLMPMKINDDPNFFLIIKAPKEMLLTAKFNKGFKIYIPKIKVGEIATTSIISVFFDNEYDPLTITTPLLDGPDTNYYREMLLQSHLDVYFFTETNIEFLGYSATIQCPEKTRSNIINASFVPANEDNITHISDAMIDWFNSRTKDDDADAMSINFAKALFPENLTIIDASSFIPNHATDSGVLVTKLERSEPGVYQEREIAQFFARIFDASKIFINPVRPEDKEEIADIVVIGDKSIIFVQAKDSPNTEKVLRNSIERKKSTTLKHLDKALRQVSGAIKYALKSPTLNFSVCGLIPGNEQDFSIAMSGLEVRGLIVIKELFREDYEKYTNKTIATCNEIGRPCIILDFYEIHKYTICFANEGDFLDAYDFVYSTGKESGNFPRLQLIPQPLCDNLSDP